MLEHRRRRICGTGWIVSVSPMEPGDGGAACFDRFTIKSAAAWANEFSVAIDKLPRANQLSQSSVCPTGLRIVEVCGQPRDIGVLLVIVKFPIEPRRISKIARIENHRT